MHHPKERGRSPSTPGTPTANNERGICRDLEPSHVAEPRWQKSRGHVDAQPRQLRSKSQPILITGYGDQRRRSDHRCEQTATRKGFGREGLARVSIPTVSLECPIYIIDQSITADAGVWRPTSSGHQASGLPIPLAALFFFMCFVLSFFCNVSRVRSGGPPACEHQAAGGRRKDETPGLRSPCSTFNYCT